MNEKESKLLELYKGNRAAVDLARMLSAVCHVWDDLIDRDKPVAPDAINAAFRMALVDIPSNPLYRQVPEDMLVLFRQAILNWHVANALEGSRERQSLEIAHVLRYSLADVFVYIAMLVGGEQHACAVGPTIRRMAQEDTLENYLKEMGHEPKPA